MNDVPPNFPYCIFFVVWIWAKLASGLFTLQKCIKSNRRYHFFSGSRFQTSTTITEFSPTSLKHFFWDIRVLDISLYSIQLISLFSTTGRWANIILVKVRHGQFNGSAKRLSFQTDRNTEPEGEGSMLKDIVPASTYQRITSDKSKNNWGTDSGRHLLHPETNALSGIMLSNFTIKSLGSGHKEHKRRGSEQHINKQHRNIENIVQLMLQLPIIMFHVHPRPNIKFDFSGASVLQL